MDSKKVQRLIGNAGIAGILFGFLNLINILFATIFSKEALGTLGFYFFGLVVVFLVLGLSYGIFKKSRACAIILFILLVITATVKLVGSVQPLVLTMYILFGYFLFRGILGTFAYHKIMKQKQEVNTTQ